MAKIQLPGGTVLAPPRKKRNRFDAYAENRSTSFRFEVLNSNNKFQGTLDGVTGGSVEWSANAQVKGVGRMTVQDRLGYNDMRVRVDQALYEVYANDFETGLGNWHWNTMLGSFDPSSNPTISTVADEGAQAVACNWASPATAGSGRDQFFGFQIANGELTVGERYTLVMRVLHNDTESTLLPEYGFYASGKTIIPSPEWQTVVWTFTAKTTGGFFGLKNLEPMAGNVTLVDRVRLYRGVATGYNGEEFETKPFDWLRVRIRPVMEIEGLPEAPLGIFLPSAPVQQWGDGGRAWAVELMDRSSILAQDSFRETYSVSAGDNVISKIKEIIRSSGENGSAITPSDKTVRTAMFWKPGTSKLTIINDLLQAADYMTLWVDGEGQFRISKYEAPKNRPVRGEFIDDDQSIYEPRFVVDHDVYNVPNRVVAVTAGTGSDAAYVGVAENDDPDSPYSYRNRGRWITDFQEGIEVATEGGAEPQAVINAYARRRLTQLSNPSYRASLQHAPVPILRVNEVVRFKRTPADIDRKFVISKTEISFDPTALQKTTLGEMNDFIEE